MVHSRTLENGGLRNRSSPRWYFSHRHAFTGGEDHPNVGCYLEVIENEKLVWTIALAPGYRPSNGPSEVPFFTAVIALEPQGKGAKYTAIVIHKDEADRKKHEEMGFHDGWGKALDQLVAHMKKL